MTSSEQDKARLAALKQGGTKSRQEELAKGRWRGRVSGTVKASRKIDALEDVDEPELPLEFG